MTKQTPKELERLTKQIAELKLQKQLALSEAQAARSRADSAIQSVKDETDRLLKERTAILADLDADIATKRKLAGSSQQALVEQDERLADRITAKHEEIAELDTAIKDKQQNLIRLDEVEQTIVLKKQTLTSLKKDQSALNASILDLHNQISDLRAQRVPLKTEVYDLSAKIQDKKAELEAFTGQHTEEITAYEAKVADLDSQIYEKRQEYTKFDTDMARERADIVRRTGDLDRRDQNLRIREAKVAQNEETIQRNANLLNL